MKNIIIAQLSMARTSLAKLEYSNYLSRFDLMLSIRAYSMLLRLYGVDPVTAEETARLAFTNKDTWKSWRSHVDSAHDYCEFRAERYHEGDEYVDHDLYRKYWREIDASTLAHEWLSYAYQFWTDPNAVEVEEAVTSNPGDFYINFQPHWARRAEIGKGFRKTCNRRMAFHGEKKPRTLPSNLRRVRRY